MPSSASPQRSLLLSIDGPAPRRPADPDDVLRLRGEPADLYVSQLTAGIRAAKLNSFFPPAPLLLAHHSFLGPKGSGGLCPALCLSPANGLPTASAILRVRVERDAAEEYVAATRPLGPGAPAPVARRLAYHQRLAEAEVMPLDRLTVELRRVDASHNAALFRVVLDRYQLATCQFVRYTILLTQHDRFWRRPRVQVESDLARPTESFREAVSGLVGQEAEVVFVLLSQVEGIEVEDVRRCRLGPMLVPGVRMGPALAELCDPVRGPCAGRCAPFILCFPEDRAGLEVADHASLDPLAPLIRELLEEPRRAVLDAKTDELGYRVAKNRKFACASPIAQPLTQLCRELGAPSVVRGVDV